MELIPMITLGLCVLGIVIIIYSLSKLKDDKIISIDDEHTEKYLKAVSQSIKDVDNSIFELESFSKSIKQELDGRYEEVLYLYSLVDEKKLQVENICKQIDEEKENREKQEKEIKSVKKVNNIVYGVDINKLKEIEDSDIRFNCIDTLTQKEEIMALYENGTSPNEIAKKLNIGLGEVRLVINFQGKQAAL